VAEGCPSTSQHLVLSQFGTVSCQTFKTRASCSMWHSPLSPLSFSPSPICGERRALSRARLVGVATAKLPASPALNEPRWVRTPRAGLSRVASTAPATSTTARRLAASGRSRSPLLLMREMIKIYEIERRDWSVVSRFTPTSLSRTGRASLLASSST
jgi:hypothetical protein